MKGYINSEKTHLYKNLDSLCNQWQKELNRLETFKKNSSSEDFELYAGPFVERVENAFAEYSNLKSLIRKYQAAMFEYTRGDLSVVLMQQRQGELVLRLHALIIEEYIT